MLQPEFEILIVEDDEDARSLIQRVVNRQFPDAAITEASDGKKGLKRFVEAGADLLIIDQRIPLLPGLDLVREVRARDAGVPIILISSTPSAEAAAFGAGINHFVDKANLLRDLPPLLSALLSRAV